MTPTSNDGHCWRVCNKEMFFFCNRPMDGQNRRESMMQYVSRSRWTHSFLLYLFFNLWFQFHQKCVSYYWWLACMIRIKISGCLLDSMAILSSRTYMIQQLNIHDKIYKWQLIHTLNDITANKNDLFKKFILKQPLSSENGNLTVLLHRNLQN